MDDEVRDEVLWLLSVLLFDARSVAASFSLLAISRGELFTGHNNGALSSLVVMPLSVSSDSFEYTGGNDGKLSCLAADRGVDGADVAVICGS